jgi:hypothetical protein
VVEAGCRVRYCKPDAEPAVSVVAARKHQTGAAEAAAEEPNCD